MPRPAAWPTWCFLNDAFAVLPRAVIEGQRIVAAMEATLILLLSRTFYVLLIIAGAALLQLPFPLTPRQNSILAFATVGIPLYDPRDLGAAPPPAQEPPRRDAAGLHPGVAGGVHRGAPALRVPAWAGFSVPEAQTALTTLTVFCGLGLLPLISTGDRAAGSGRLSRWWPWSWP